MEQPGEVAHAQVRPGREGFEGEVLGEVFGDPPPQLVDPVVLQALDGQRHAELALPAGAFDVHHHHPGRRECEVLAVVLGDHGQRHVHPRGDAGAGPHPPVPDEDRIGIDPDVGVLGRQPACGEPVGRSRPAVEQPRSGQQVRPRADRSDPPSPGPRTAQPVGDLAVDHRLHRVVDQFDRPRHQQGVHPAVRVVEGQVGHQPDATGGGHRAAVGRRDLHEVAGPVDSGDAGGDGEHLGRAGDVQQLDAGKGDDHDAVRLGHALIIPLDRTWPQ